MGFATGFDLLFKISGGGKALLLSAICLGIDATKSIKEKNKEIHPHSGLFNHNKTLFGRMGRC